MNELTLVGGTLVSTTTSGGETGHSHSNHGHGSNHHDHSNLSHPAQEPLPGLEMTVSRGGAGGGNTHDHNHGGGDACCHKPVVLKPTLSLKIPASELVQQQTADQLYGTLHNLVRMGSYDLFLQICDALVAYNAKPTGGLDSPAKPSLETLLTQRDPHGHALLHWAAKRVDEVRFVTYLAPYFFANNDKEPLASTDETAMTPLHWACTVPHALPLIRALLQASSSSSSKDTNAQALAVRDSTGCPPLLIAAQHGQVESVAYLLQAGADLHATDHNGDSATHWAAYKGSESVLGLLSYYDTRQLLQPDAYGQMPLHLAALRGHTSVCRTILRLLSTRDAKQVLQQKDKNGRTPLALAIHKQKPTVAQVLRAAEETHTRKATLQRMLESCKNLCCSVHSWKMWLGLAQVDDMDESPRFPFYYVVFQIALHVVYFLWIFFPAWDTQKGLLWDYMTLQVVTILGMGVVCWALYQTAYTNPGRLVDATTPEDRAQVAHYRKLYETTLEAYAHDNPAEQSQWTLCHSCHVARPPRSKHDRFTRSCILLFDHHCPFVGNSVGLYNYRYFYLFVASMTLYFAGFWILFAIHTHRNTRHEVFPVILGIYMGLHVFFPLGMWVYHTQLTWMNLSTNEHMNLQRYPYFWASTSSVSSSSSSNNNNSARRFVNPWNKGCWGNFQDRLFPQATCYEIQSEQRPLTYAAGDIV